ncbi:tryptophan--tRNA ligase [Candidatus Uhrbacteria bacterium RIFCSPLOWO2_02_FULL_51_9]|uniref:Tryptophan--tRNA ligase n=1 Tax=Candidatus Uhrbacteria bacterium RIFCSPLOWO2_02_FULL_51_9 TaxID=1802410 RepID=A0A1F7VGZ2_9BACT|nr:MAG: tryptophan--tRNA ligase [Candidatus Uhrbacteria bacterium RIFCSPLOWO2_02_FULL_51_9]
MTIVVSGIQPSGPLHIGNYLGALRYWLELQKKYTCYFFIADLHFLTQGKPASEVRENTCAIAAELLALGINPKRATFFVQSHVPAHTELAWILNCVTPIAELERMTQYKDKASRQAENINAGLLTYPVLQAADIVIYQGAVVPVGEDQVQHLELTRNIARWFNNRYGKTFAEPKPMLTPTPRVMSLTSPMQKMSKSLGEKNVIGLADEPLVILEKIAKAVTESTGVIPVAYTKGQWKLTTTETVSEGVIGAYNLLKLLETFGTKEENMRFTKAPIAYRELKETLARAIASHFAEFRTRRKKLLRQKSSIEKHLVLGAKRANQITQKTITAVRKKIGVR